VREKISGGASLIGILPSAFWFPNSVWELKNEAPLQLDKEKSNNFLIIQAWKLKIINHYN
jgi:hypothetical protein